MTGQGGEKAVEAASCTSTELMLVAAARACAGARTGMAGVGLPVAALLLARAAVAPELTLISDAGIYGMAPARPPLSLGDPALVSGALAICSMADVFGLYLQGGRIEVVLLGAAQIDRHGNANTTVIEDYAAPAVRLPGSGGACEMATHAQRLLYMLPLSRRAFVERVDFITSPGHAPGSTEPRAPGQTARGPELVITDVAVFDFANAEREMQLVALYPGVATDTVRARVGWPLRVAPALTQTAPPTLEELAHLRALMA